MTTLVGPELLDRKIVDLAGAPIGKVDDVEMCVGEDGLPEVTALVVGRQAPPSRLSRWIGGLTGRPAEPPGPIRISWDLVAFCDTRITLSVRKEMLTDPSLERWLRGHADGR
jgi:sporulation protein YlmC with PRC-barrel domain